MRSDGNSRGIDIGVGMKQRGLLSEQETLEVGRVVLSGGGTRCLFLVFRFDVTKLDGNRNDNLIYSSMQDVYLFQ